MQLTWLDLLAANIAAMLWLWGVMAARHWWQTERNKTVPTFILLSLVGVGLAIFVSRADFWYDAMLNSPHIIVPAAEQASAAGP